LHFHFNRGADFSNQGEKRFAPIERLNENCSYFYYRSYDQIKSEIHKLIKAIHNDKENFGQGDSEIKIHLLGYSLEGAAAELQERVSFFSVLFLNWKIVSVRGSTCGKKRSCLRFFKLLGWQKGVKLICGSNG